MTLLGPDLLCEVIIHVNAEGQRKLYVSKMETQQDVQRVVEQVIYAGVDLARERGIFIRWEKLQEMYPYKEPKA